MKKKLVCMIIVTLFISTVMFPIANAFKLENNIIETVDEPKIEIYLPDVHVYYSKSRISWGRVEFDEPGAVIEVDLSEIEESGVKARFIHKIICHVEGQLLPSLVISTVSQPEKSAMSLFEFIGSTDNWERSVGHAYFSIDKVEDETFPLVVAITGVPVLFRWAVGIYYSLMLNFFPELIFDIPNQLEKTYGEITEYQLHVHT